MPRRWGISGPTSRPIENPVGATGLTAAVGALLTALFAIFDWGVDPEVVGAIASGVVGILAAVIFRQPPRDQLPPPPPPSD